MGRHEHNVVGTEGLQRVRPKSEFTSVRVSKGGKPWRPEARR